MFAFARHRNWLAAVLLSGGLLSGGLTVTGHGSAHQQASTPVPSGPTTQATPGASDQPCNEGQDGVGHEDPNTQDATNATPNAGNNAGNEEGSAGEQDQTDTNGEQADGSNEATSDESGPNDNQAGEATAASTPGTLTEGSDLLPQATISLDQAIQAAQAATQGTLGQVELTDSDGTLAFDVEIGDQDVLVDASNGSIISVEPRNSDSSGTDSCTGNDAAEANAAPGTLVEGQELAGQATISVQQAIDAAQKAATGNLGVVGLEDRNGTLVYTVKVGDQEVTVDATTGEVLATDQED